MPLWRVQFLVARRHADDRKDGRFSTSLTLEQGRPYRYRYIVDGERWVDDPAADEYVDNGYGTKDSVVVV